MIITLVLSIGTFDLAFGGCVGSPNSFADVAAVTQAVRAGSQGLTQASVAVNDIASQMDPTKYLDKREQQMHSQNSSYKGSRAHGVVMFNGKNGVQYASGFLAGSSRCEFRSALHAIESELTRKTENGVTRFVTDTDEIKKIKFDISFGNLDSTVKSDNRENPLAEAQKYFEYTGVKGEIIKSGNGRAHKVNDEWVIDPDQDYIVIRITPCAPINIDPILPFPFEAAKAQAEAKAKLKNSKPKSGIIQALSVGFPWDKISTDKYVVPYISECELDISYNSNVITNNCTANYGQSGGAIFGIANGQAYYYSNTTVRYFEALPNSNAKSFPMSASPKLDKHTQL